MKGFRQKGFCIILFFLTIFNAFFLGEAKEVENRIESKEAFHETALIVSQNSLDSLHWLKLLIASANHTVDLCPCMAGGAILEQILEAARQRLSEVPTLRVRMLAQAIFFDELDYQRVDAMRADFGDRFSFQLADFIALPFPELGVYELHQKYSIIDGKYFVVGGTNFEDCCCGDGSVEPAPNETPRRYMHAVRPIITRDQDIIGRNEYLGEKIATTFAKIYRLWEAYAETKVAVLDPEKFADSADIRLPTPEKQSTNVVFEEFEKKRVVPVDNVDFLVCGPYQKKGENPITQSYLDLIRGAQTSIKISNLFFMPKKEVLAALRDAVNRGVYVEVITNGIHDRSPDLIKLFGWGSRYCFPDLLWGRPISFWDKFRIGSFPIKDVGIYEYYVKEVQTHKKIMIVDGKHIVIGSYNLGTKSESIDQECVIVAKDVPEVAADMTEIFELDRSLSKRVTIEETKSWLFSIKLNALASLQYRGQVS